MLVGQGRIVGYLVPIKLLVFWVPLGEVASVVSPLKGERILGFLVRFASILAVMVVRRAYALLARGVLAVSVVAEVDRSDCKAVGDFEGQPSRAQWTQCSLANCWDLTLTQYYSSLTRFSSPNQV